MKIVADENIIYLDEFFGADAFSASGHADTACIDLVKKAGRSICQPDLVDADVLLVRSVTQVNAELLQGTQVKFVGTATIGTDHIDLDYLYSQKIRFADAGGCSADTVAQYVIHCIHHIHPHFFQPHMAKSNVAKADTAKNTVIGIIGYGNIGKSLANLASQMGWQSLIYDPFVTIDAAENVAQVTLDEVLTKSNVISLHVPLTTAVESKHPTYHLINKETLAKTPSDTLLINSARGKVVCEADLLADIKVTDRKVVLDVFEHEPELNSELIDKLTVATPHIAGYSLEGKARGTQFIYDAFCDWLDCDAVIRFEKFLPNEQQLFQNNPTNVIDLLAVMQPLYNVSDDDMSVRSLTQGVNKKSASTKSKTTNSSQQQGQLIQQKNGFDKLRKEYPLRREWQAYGLQALCQS